jgi:sterol desaturase/sphingolipid hydroxylase (fatty acid hydroxylase superfamily)
MDGIAMFPPLAQIVIFIVLVLFILLLTLECLFPLRRRTTSFFGRLLPNICLTVATFAVGSLLVKPFALVALAWSGETGVGLLHLISLPKPIRVIVGFLLLDLTFYYWHRLNHELSILWRFHRVHHIDPDLDITTSFRFHFGEIAYSAIFRMIQVVLLGIDLPTFLLYELVFQSATMFQHSNLRLPIGLERLLNKIIVTPRMHGIHHSQIMRETNSNYSVVFRFWDHLNRTLRLNIPQRDIAIGVDGFQRQRFNRVWNLFLNPFRRGFGRGKYTEDEGRVYQGKSGHMCE